jgi:hypothetical protein
MMLFSSLSRIASQRLESAEAYPCVQGGSVDKLGTPTFAMHRRNPEGAT